MLMGLGDFLALAKTSEEKDKIRENFLRLLEFRNREIDWSDMPEKTDSSKFKRLKPYLDKIRNQNKMSN